MDQTYDQPSKELMPINHEGCLALCPNDFPKDIWARIVKSVERPGKNMVGYVNAIKTIYEIALRFGEANDDFLNRFKANENRISFTILYTLGRLFKGNSELAKEAFDALVKGMKESKQYGNIAELFRWAGNI